MSVQIDRPIIFTDLDGTLLDHDTYSWAPAAEALEDLRRRQIPVVLNSSKTLAELRPLRRALGLDHPVICENGAFIDVPQGYFTSAMPLRAPPPSREVVQAAYLEVTAGHRYRCEAFFELGVAGIARVTGLDAASAARANDRHATEPVLWHDSAAALEQFSAAIAALGLRCVRGGRFLHVMGDADKASAMGDLMAAWARETPLRPPTSIALGDGPNDIEMLAAADIAVIVRARHGQHIDLGDHGCVIRTEEYGPAGWHNAIRQLLGTR